MENNLHPSSFTKDIKTTPSQKRLIPVTKWNQHHEWPTLGGLRHLIFHENTNGFNKVVRRCGRRVLIDEQSFFVWMDAQNNQNKEI